MCDCIETINAKLKDGGHRLKTTMTFDGSPSRPLIPLIRLDAWKIETRRGQPSSFFPSFCPFCGEKYPVKEGAAS